LQLLVANTAKRLPQHARPDLFSSSFGLDDLTATVKAVRRDVVAQVHFTSGGLYCGAWGVQSVVGTVHAALGRGFFVLLNCHGGLLVLITRFVLKQTSKAKSGKN
jgi:hypothetical protein